MANPCTKDRTVKNIKLYLAGMDANTRYGIQQFLEWFEVDRKLERIVWSMLRKKEIRSRKEAERLTTKLRKKPVGYELKEMRGPVPSEPRQMAPIGTCDCGGLVTGEPLPGCESRKTGRVFFKECNTCSYYSELFKIDDTFKEIEGG